MIFAGALLAGVLFGAGLLLSGMTNPANVLAFLDVAGDWNPALALTMAGAILAAAPAFARVRRTRMSLAGAGISLPSRTRIDRHLVGGSMVFGIGWGLSGICPGPAVVLLATGSAAAFTFAGSVAAGLLVGGLLDRGRR